MRILRSLLFILAQFFTLTNLLTSSRQSLQAQETQASEQWSIDFDDPTPYFTGNELIEALNGKTNVDEYLRYSTHSLAQVANMDTDLHRYDNADDLRGSAPHQADAKRCNLWLHFILGEVRLIFASSDAYSRNTNLNLLEFLDSFGSPEAQLLKGNAFWHGSSDQCQQFKFVFGRAKADNNLSSPHQAGTQDDQTDDQDLDVRYCIAKLRSPSSRHSGSRISAELKLGVCVPAICDSRVAATSPETRHLIAEILKTARLPSVPYSSYQLTELYCLPDERSPLRQFSPSALVFLTAVGGWLVLVFVCSVHTELAKRTRSSLVSVTFANQLSLSENLRRLFANPSTSAAPQKWPPPQSTVDLSAVDGLKVVSMTWLIAAHSLLFYMRPPLVNARDLWRILRDARYLTIMAGIFPVDSFFTLTGVLTAYLQLSRSSFQQLVRPQHWLDAVVRRYLRFLPMYALIFLYARELAVYTGSGPFWDYATANSTLRSVCKRESFLVPLTFTANFKPLEEHCVQPAWYLASDLQFLAVTPFFLIPLVWRPALGKALIVGSIVLSLVAQFSTVFFAEGIKDFETIINFKPMFATYVLSIFWRLYELPHNRITPYLIGLLVGQALFQRKTAQIPGQAEPLDKLSEISKTRCCSTATNVDDSGLTTLKGDEDSLSDCMAAVKSLKKMARAQPESPVSEHNKLVAPLVTLASLALLPLVPCVLTMHGLMAKIGTSAIIPLMRLLWSIAVGRLVWLVCSSAASDSLLARILASSFWRPLAKMGLSALLIQWQVLYWLTQTRLRMHEMTYTFLASTALLAIVATYVLSFATFLLFELPITRLETVYAKPVLELNSLLDRFQVSFARCSCNHKPHLRTGDKPSG